MVTIRLTRRGAKNQPFYHVVVTDSRERQGGASLEQVGYFNPVARGKDTRLKLDLERIDHWVARAPSSPIACASWLRSTASKPRRRPPRGLSGRVGRPTGAPRQARTEYWAPQDYAVG